MDIAVILIIRPTAGRHNVVDIIVSASSFFGKQPRPGEIRFELAPLDFVDNVNQQAQWLGHCIS